MLEEIQKFKSFDSIESDLMKNWKEFENKNIWKQLQNRKIISGNKLMSDLSEIDFWN